MSFVFRFELAVASSDLCSSLSLNPGPVFNSVYILLKRKIQIEQLGLYQMLYKTNHDIIGV